MTNPERVDGGPASEKSLRDYFAAQALPNVMAYGIKDTIFDPEAIAEDAYKVADAMLAERRKA